MTFDLRALGVSCPLCRALVGVSCSAMTKTVGQRFCKPHTARLRMWVAESIRKAIEKGTRAPRSAKPSGVK